ncbi:MAG: hypothetical protein IPK19_37925 [Chloroflexi bacterium]|nr:hypothetical protein [Chloroflexota bacterium]
MMRLPGSINTKPERGGAVVHFLELHPERRAPYDAFAWLERQPERQMPMTASLPFSSEMDEHRLPDRTQAYLARGAAPGSRNAELLAAACQFRDAGYSQTDAERELVPRHVADGCTEAEALATIRSAYSRPPRDPLLTPRDRVDQLVSQFGRRTEAQAPPTAAQIAETVQACGDLNPLEWAEVRAQIKAVSGSGLKVADLDRMYREARRDRQRSAPRAEDAERYVERDGGMVYEKENERGVSRLTIADWTGRVLEWRAHVDDDGQVERQIACSSSTRLTPQRLMRLTSCSATPTPWRASSPAGRAASSPRAPACRNTSRRRSSGSPPSRRAARPTASWAGRRSTTAGTTSPRNSR